MDTQQPPIPNPPRAITSKDILYLKDALSWELLAFKKFHFLAGLVSDSNIKEALDRAGKMHQKHFERLLTHLQVNNDDVMANIPSPKQAKNSSK
ncbi:ferritin-like domain-containing protein [Peribacillus glennii]|uniref:Ferritin-like domain-containing protein n=1 Tax=Peribacillus glennii TaxID=2303991 RepID=A0A372LH66_9BACI|nr:ferritin-like domain-containing protein [Peribacillus glennii]RFU64956.1 ferritin-like domain-containing protein [Peribacillus glennii]